MGLRELFSRNYYFHQLYYRICFWLPSYVWGAKWDRFVTRKKFRKVFGYDLNLDCPKTLNEKIQWLKLMIHDDFHTTCADKLAVRNIWKHYGEDGLIPLLYVTEDWREITEEHIPDTPCIVKYNAGSNSYEIIRDKAKVDFQALQKKCRMWMATNYYYRSQEWQYKNIKPCIVVEKLLLDVNGHIPNDYKLHFINGKIAFIYCSVDREGENYRLIYTPEWKRIDMEWIAKENHHGLVQKDIAKPVTLSRMIEIGTDIAKRFSYVRVDFYEVDGRLYYGEITLHHGSGFDTFEPERYDTYYGKKLVLQEVPNK